MIELEHSARAVTEAPTARLRLKLLEVLATAAACAYLLLASTGCDRSAEAAASPASAKPAKAAAATQLASPTDGSAIRPFTVNFPEQAIADLRRRINDTRWPPRETVSDQSQGVQLAKLQPLLRYWGTDYDWRKLEAKLNNLPQFVTTIDGLDIQFIHVRSRHPNALPLLITHGWPGSILELVKAIGPLTDPTAHGGRAEEAFDVVVPSMPGYGFSDQPKSTGWGPDRIARAWAVLMSRLGYKRYVAQGGDWGSVVADSMARQAPPGLLGIHVNMPATVPGDVMKSILSGGPAPSGLSADEKAAFDSLSTFFGKNAGYGAMMVARPQTVGYGLSDSPAGLAAWMYDKFAQWTYSGGDPERSLTKDEMLDDITLYWLTNSAISSAQLYWENNNNNFSAAAQKTADISLPVAVTVFPGEIYRAPKSWTQRAYRKLGYFHEVDKGGHFAAWEEPELFASELRAAFKAVRYRGCLFINAGASLESQGSCRRRLGGAPRSRGPRPALIQRHEGESALHRLLEFDRPARTLRSLLHDQSGGMGIGLWVSRAIIESHGGRIWVEPHAGPGATFCVSLRCRV